MFDRITITGADDSVTPEDLVKLSSKYPFVEWGILISASQMGGKRFPSMEWMNRLAKLQSVFSMNLSAHICGRWVRELAAGIIPSVEGKLTSDFPAVLLKECARLQLNFHAEKTEFSDDFIRLIDILHQDVIIQMDGVNDGILYTLAERHSERVLFFRSVDALFDISHGAGVLPEAWPKPIPGQYCGYAGGLGPDNLEEQMAKIDAVVGVNRAWVDMETKVRSNGDKQFDLAKVEQCLQIASRWID